MDDGGTGNGDDPTRAPSRGAALRRLRLSHHRCSAAHSRAGWRRGGRWEQWRWCCCGERSDGAFVIKKAPVRWLSSREKRAAGGGSDSFAG